MNVIKNKSAMEMLIAMSICGTIGITVHFSGASEVSLIFYRCLFGALTLLGFCFFKKYLTRKLLTPKIILFSLLGGAALLINWYFLFSSYGKTSIGISTTIYNTQPLMMIFLGRLIFKEIISRNDFVWIFVSLFGLLMVSNISHLSFDGRFNSVYIVGVFEALAAAFFYAIATVFAKLLKGTPPSLVALFQMLLGLICLLPFSDLSILTEPSLTRETILVVTLGVVHTGIMYMFLYSALQNIEAYKAASISFIYPAIALVIDSIFLNVSIVSSQWLGITLILFGAAGVNLKWKITTVFNKKKGIIN